MFSLAPAKPPLIFLHVGVLAETRNTYIFYIMYPRNEDKKTKESAVVREVCGHSIETQAKLLVRRSVRDTIIRMFKAGVEVECIADATGVPQAGVIAVLARESLWKSGSEEYRKDLVGPAVKQGVITAYRDYAPVRAVCKRFGITSRQFWQIVSEEGEPTRPRRRLLRALSKSRRNVDVVEMYQAGELIEEIIDTCGVSRPLIYRILEEMGVKPNRVDTNAWRRA